MMAKQMYSEKSRAAVYLILASVHSFVIPRSTHFLPATSAVLDGVFRLELNLSADGVSLRIRMHANTLFRIGRVSVLQLGRIIFDLVAQGRKGMEVVFWGDGGQLGWVVRRHFMKRTSREWKGAVERREEEIVKALGFMYCAG